MCQNDGDLLLRTKSFAVRVIHLVQALPVGRIADVLGKQLLRSATSVSANYRAAKRGRSKAQFIAKLGIVEEELDESLHWLALIVDSGLISESRLSDLKREADELLCMIVSSIKTARSNVKK